jgi:hypothetical protein
MAGGFHLRSRPGKRRNDLAEVMETFAAFVQPVGVDARAFQRLNQFELGAAVVQGEAQCPLGGMATVLAALALRSEDPPTPRP